MSSFLELCNRGVFANLNIVYTMQLVQFGKVYMCIVYWTMHLLDKHIIIYVLLVISELERMRKEAAAA